MGVVHKADPGWASFIPVLVKCLELTDGPVLELGMGIFSTPLLHILCETQNRLLCSYESDERYTEMLNRFKGNDHWVFLVDDWDSAQWSNMGWSVALVDSKPAESRKELIKQLTNVDYVIIHDSNDPIYDYESIYPLFKYKFTHEYLQHTTVLSNVCSFSMDHDHVWTKRTIGETLSIHPNHIGKYNGWECVDCGEITHADKKPPGGWI